MIMIGNYFSFSGRPDPFREKAFLLFQIGVLHILLFFTRENIILDLILN